MELLESDRGQGSSKGIKGPKGSGEDKEDRGLSLFPFIRLVILHLHTSHPHLHLVMYIAFILAVSTHSPHYTVALDSGSEARYERRQGRGLGIKPLYLVTFRGLAAYVAARCSRLCHGIV